MATLCIDTATDFGTLAIAIDGQTLASASWKSSARHGEHLFGHIDTVLQNAGLGRQQIEAIGVSIGPGKFTSLRVGLSAAKGIAMALDVPIVGVSALRVLGRSPSSTTPAIRIPIMNAYRGDVFAAAYDFEESDRDELMSPTFGAPEVVLAKIRDAIGSRASTVSGEGAVSAFDAARSTLSLTQGSAGEVTVAPDPAALVLEVTEAHAARGSDDLASLEPQYLRPSDATLPDKPLRMPG